MEKEQNTIDEEIQKIVDEQNGFLRIVDVQKTGISKHRINMFIEGMNMRRVGAGVYAIRRTKDDWWYYLQLRNRNIIFSYESALYLNKLTTRKPENPVITVVRGYNAKHIKDRGVLVHTVAEDVFELGLSTAKTDEGNEVRVYNKERCICDLLRRKSRIDQKTLLLSLSKYFEKNNEDYERLMEYAEIMGVTDRIAPYLD